MPGARSEPTQNGAAADDGASGAGSRRFALTRLLEAYVPSGPAEERHHLRMLDLLTARGDEFSRHHFWPGHFTASAFVVSSRSDRLLMVHHRRLDTWLQPGGHVDPEDRDLVEAARRETAEETGITELALGEPAPFDLDVHPIPMGRGEPRHEHFDVRFLFTTPAVPPTASDEVKAARWVDFDDVPRFTSDRSVMRAVGKIAR